MESLCRCYKCSHCVGVDRWSHCVGVIGGVIV